MDFIYFILSVPFGFCEECLFETMFVEYLTTFTKLVKGEY